MSDNPIPEELVSLLYVIADDKRLCESLVSLQQFPLGMRQAELRRIAAQMRSDGVNVAVADAISALTQPRLFDAACSAIRELYL